MPAVLARVPADASNFGLVDGRGIILVKFSGQSALLLAEATGLAEALVARVAQAGAAAGEFFGYYASTVHIVDCVLTLASDAHPCAFFDYLVEVRKIGQLFDLFYGQEEVRKLALLVEGADEAKAFVTRAVTMLMGAHVLRSDDLIITSADLVHIATVTTSQAAAPSASMSSEPAAAPGSAPMSASQPELAPAALLEAQEIRSGLTLDMACDSDGVPVLLGLMEMATMARVRTHDRDESVDWVHSAIAARAAVGLGIKYVSRPTWLGARDQLVQGLSTLMRGLPSPELHVMLTSPLEARRMVQHLMEGPLGDPNILTARNVRAAVFLETGLHAILRGTPAKPMLTGFSALALKLRVGGASAQSHSVASVKVVGGLVDTMTARFTHGEEAAMAPAVRLTSALELLTARAERTGTSHATSDGGSLGTVEQLLSSSRGGLQVGYPRSNRLKLRTKVDSHEFIKLQGVVTSCLTQMRDAPAGLHASHQAVKDILGTKEIIFFHALSGDLDELAEVPEVKVVATEVRMHVPAALGHYGFNLLMPKGMLAVDDGQYPRLNLLWAEWSKGNLDVCYEELLVYAVQNFYDQGTRSCKFGDRFKDMAALRQIQRALHPTKGFFALMGFDCLPAEDAMTMFDFVSDALEYYDEAAVVPVERRQVVIQEYLSGLLSERTALLQRSFRTDPLLVLGASIRVPGSEAQRMFELERAKSGGQYVLRKSLVEMGITVPVAAEGGMVCLMPGASLGVANQLTYKEAASGKTSAELAAAAEEAAAEVARAAKKEKKKLQKEAEKAAKAAAAAGGTGLPEIGEIGDLSHAVNEDVEKNTITFKNFKGAVADTFPRKAFYETFGDDACPGVLLSRSLKAWRFCNCPKDASAEVRSRHSTRAGGAHAPKAGAKAAWLALLAGMAKTGSAAPTPPMTTPHMLFGEVSKVAMPPRDNAHVFVPVLANNGSVAVGLPSGEGAMFGCERTFASRDEDLAQAQGWSDDLFRNSVEAVHPFYFCETEAAPKVVISGVLLADSAAACEWAVPDKAQEAGICWCTLKGERLTSEFEANSTTHGIGAICAVAVARAMEFVRPTAALPPGYKTGALAERYLNPQQMAARASAHVARPWDSVMSECETLNASIVNTLEQSLANRELSSEQRADLQGWLDVARAPVSYAGIEPELQQQCYCAFDARLGDVPFPHGARPVSTAPYPKLSDPPPFDRVPKGVTSWEAVMQPRTYRRAVECELSHLEYWRYISIHGHAEGAVKPRLFACGASGLRPLYAKLVREGHVLVMGPDGITLLDKSKPPTFTLNPAYWERILKDSNDHGLRSALVTHGVSYHTEGNLGPQLVICPPGENLCLGTHSARDLVGKMEQPPYHWFGLTKCKGLEQGVLTVESWPGRVGSTHMVPKAHSDEWRMVINNTYPPPGTYTTMGEREEVISINAASGTREDRALRKAQWRQVEGAMSKAPKVVSAQPNEWVPSQVNIAGDAGEGPAVVSSSLAGARQAEQTGVCGSARDGEILPGLPGGPVLPPEFKAYFKDLMVTICIMSYAAAQAGTQVVCFGDDYHKAFHQFATMVAQTPYCAQYTLDPSAADDALAEASLVSVLERCMSMGTTASSNYCQRALTEFCEHFQRKVGQVVAPLVAEMRANRPAFDAYLQQRERLSKVTGQDESRLVVAFSYSDDPTICTLLPLLPSTLLCWGEENACAGLIRAKATKRSIGANVSWVGGSILVPGLIAHLPKAKALRAAEMLRTFVAGQMSVKAFYEMTGLLHHITYMLCLPRYYMADIYEGIDRMRAESGEPQPDSIVRSTSRSIRAGTAMARLIMCTPGASLLSSIFETAPPPSLVRWRMHSDAAIKGTRYPAMCGNLYSRVYVLPLAQHWIDLLPIVALEFLAEGPLNLMAFGSFLVDAPVVIMPCDSLVAPTVMASRASGSALLRFIHAEMMQLPIFVQLRDKLVCSHEYGVGNPVTDGGSRGKEGTMREVMRAMGLTPHMVDVSEQMVAFVDKVAEYARSLSNQPQGGDAPPSMDATSVDLGVAAQSVAAPNMPIAHMDEASMASGDVCEALMALLRQAHAGETLDARRLKLVAQALGVQRLISSTMRALTAAFAYMGATAYGERDPAGPHTEQDWLKYGARKSNFHVWLARVCQLLVDCEPVLELGRAGSATVGESGSDSAHLVAADRQSVDDARAYREAVRAATSAAAHVAAAAAGVGVLDSECEDLDVAMSMVAGRRPVPELVLQSIARAAGAHRSGPATYRAVTAALRVLAEYGEGASVQASELEPGGSLSAANKWLKRLERLLEECELHRSVEGGLSVARQQSAQRAGGAGSSVQAARGHAAVLCADDDERFRRRGAHPQPPWLLLGKEYSSDVAGDGAPGYCVNTACVERQIAAAFNPEGLEKWSKSRLQGLLGRIRRCGTCGYGRCDACLGPRSMAANQSEPGCVCWDTGREGQDPEETSTHIEDARKRTRPVSPSPSVSWADTGKQFTVLNQVTSWQRSGHVMTLPELRRAISALGEVRAVLLQKHDRTEDEIYNFHGVYNRLRMYLCAASVEIRHGMRHSAKMRRRYRNIMELLDAAELPEDQISRWAWPTAQEVLALPVAHILASAVPHEEGGSSDAGTLRVAEGDGSVARPAPRGQSSMALPSPIAVLAAAIPGVHGWSGTEALVAPSTYLWWGALVMAILAVCAAWWAARLAKAGTLDTSALQASFDASAAYTEASLPFGSRVSAHAAQRAADMRTVPRVRRNAVSRERSGWLSPRTLFVLAMATGADAGQMLMRTNVLGSVLAPGLRAGSRQPLVVQPDSRRAAGVTMPAVSRDTVAPEAPTAVPVAERGVGGRLAATHAPELLDLGVPPSGLGQVPPIMALVHRLGSPFTRVLEPSLGGAPRGAHSLVIPGPVGPPRGLQTFVRTIEARTDHRGVDGTFAAWEQALLQDSSPMAILPGRSVELAGLIERMREHLDHAFADSTNRSDQYHLKAWRRACEELGTPCWRTDVAANMGLDANGYRREQILQALVFMKMYARMAPRSKQDPAANPRSCLQKLYAVGREHKKRGMAMAPFTLAVRVMTGMLHEYVVANGTEALVPSRKCPLTNAMILSMLQIPDGVGNAHLRVAWGDDFWIAVRATIATLAETGMRKGDVSKATAGTRFTPGRLTFAKLKWRIGGVELAHPSQEQLASLGRHASDGCWMVYGVLKNDAFGEHFGAKPSWLPFDALEARNACRALAALEMRASRAGMLASDRASVPLFGPVVGQEWHHSQLENVFEFLLEYGCGLATKAARLAYSLHSFRIYLACALYAAGCPNDRIMAILRWRSEEALSIYARLNDPERTDWIVKAKRTVVDSTVTAHLPRIDADDMVAALQASIRSGELGAAAALADAGTLPEEGAAPVRSEASRAHALAAAVSRAMSSMPAGTAPPALRGGTVAASNILRAAGTIQRTVRARAGARAPLVAASGDPEVAAPARGGAASPMAAAAQGGAAAASNILRAVGVLQRSLRKKNGVQAPVDPALASAAAASPSPGQ